MISVLVVPYFRSLARLDNGEGKGKSLINFSHRCFDINIVKEEFQSELGIFHHHYFNIY